MNRTKLIVLGALFTSLAVIFHMVPVLFSEALVLITMLSALPIYITAKMDPKIGLAGYITAAILITLFSSHEGLFFTCANGVVGLTLGLTHYYTNKKIIIISTSTVTLTLMLSIMTFLMDISIFGFVLSTSFFIQLCILIIFSLLYNIFYFYIANLVFKKIFLC